MTEHNASLALYFFNQISVYPRQPGKEGKIRAFIKRWASAHRYHTTIDTCGNCIISVPAHKSRKKSPSLALQAHMDMVCEKVPGHIHDFSKDPIVPEYENGWVSAPNTTLGADNGIGIALAMALVEDPLVVHPELELVFTVDEESGLTGAAGLAPDAIKSKFLLNIDSEDDAVLINGCAGGMNIHFEKEYQVEADENFAAHPTGGGYTLMLNGFRGGHSGVDIGKKHGNAIHCGAHLLHAVISRMPDRCYIGPLQGGTVHNAIPREFEAYVFCIDGKAQKEAKRIMQEALGVYATEHGRALEGLRVDLAPTEKRPPVRSTESARNILRFLTSLPNGVKSYTKNPAIPQTSSNIAHIATTQSRDQLLVSVRSSHKEELEEFAHQISAHARKYQVTATPTGMYPAWHPRPHSPLLSKCRSAYTRVRGVSPRVEVIHAGLEPSVITQTFPDLDMLSCGPLILNPHSPQERLSIQSTARIYAMLGQLLRDW